MISTGIKKENLVFWLVIGINVYGGNLFPRIIYVLKAKNSDNIFEKSVIL